MKTTCEFCLFSKKEEGKQVGCHLNRIELFKNEYVNNHYELLGYCNTCRNETWNHKNKSLEEQIELVHQENAPNFEFTICHSDNDDEVKNQIRKILDLNINISEIIVVTNSPSFQVLYNDLYNEFQKSFIRVVFAYNSKDELSKILEILTKNQKVESLYRVVLGKGSTLDNKSIQDALEMWKNLKVIVGLQDKCFTFFTAHTKDIIGYLLRDEYNNNKLQQSESNSQLSEECDKPEKQ